MVLSSFDFIITTSREIENQRMSKRIDLGLEFL